MKPTIDETSKGVYYTYDTKEFYGNLFFKEKLDGYELDGNGIFKFKLSSKYSKYVSSSPSLDTAVFYGIDDQSPTIEPLLSSYFESVIDGLIRLKKRAMNERNTVEEIINHVARVEWSDAGIGRGYYIDENGVSMSIGGGGNKPYHYTYSNSGQGFSPVLNFRYRTFEIDEDDGGVDVTPLEAIGYAMTLTSHAILGIYDEMDDQIDDLTRIIKGQF